MKVSFLGEYKLVKQILKRLLLHPVKFCIVPPGDDAFITKFSAGNYLICTTDLLIDNVHFSTGWSEILKPAGINLFYSLGYKSLAVNLSDFAAMGEAKPLYCLVGLGIPENFKVRYIDDLYCGLEDFAKKHNIKIVGGDTNSATNLIIAIVLIGTIKKSGIVTRSGAKIGDSIYLTGTLGDSSAGLSILKSGNKLKLPLTKEEKYFIRKHLFPPIRLKEAKTISKFATSMIDCSDGLVQSIKLLCEASKVGAEVYLDRIPVSENLKVLFPKNYIEFILYGGEDYELIFTANQKDATEFSFITPIGKITSSKLKLFYYGKELKIQQEKIFYHFKQP